MKRKIIQLQTVLNDMTSAEVNSLKLDNDDVTMYSGSTVFYMLREYSDRYMICEDKDEFLFKWAAYTSYKLPDFIKAYDAVYSNYNPLENYSKHETNITQQRQRTATIITPKTHRTV